MVVFYLTRVEKNKELQAYVYARTDSKSSAHRDDLIIPDLFPRKCTMSLLR